MFVSRVLISVRNVYVCVDRTSVHGLQPQCVSVVHQWPCEYPLNYYSSGPADCWLKTNKNCISAVCEVKCLCNYEESPQDVKEVSYCFCYSCRVLLRSSAVACLPIINIFNYIGSARDKLSCLCWRRCMSAGCAGECLWHGTRPCSYQTLAVSVFYLLWRGGGELNDRSGHCLSAHSLRCPVTAGVSNQDGP